MYYLIIRPIIIYLYKLYINFIIHPQARIDGVVDCFKKIKIGKGVIIKANTFFGGEEIGDFSYIGQFSYVSDKVKIGRFCSLAAGVKIYSSNHNLNSVSTYPLYAKFYHDWKLDGQGKEILIGNDVWIGVNSIILPGVTIGDGAIIGAGSVVNKNIEPYAIYVGNPARFLRFRFTEGEIEQLRKIEWWNWDVNKIKAFSSKFYNKQDFLDLNN